MQIKKTQGIKLGIYILVQFLNGSRTSCLGSSRAGNGEDMAERQKVAFLAPNSNVDESRLIFL